MLSPKTSKGLFTSPRSRGSLLSWIGWGVEEKGGCEIDYSEGVDVTVTEEYRDPGGQGCCSFEICDISVPLIPASWVRWLDD